MPEREQMIEGRNAVLEALRAERSVDRVLIQDGVKEGAIGSIIREVKKHPETKLEFVQKKKLDDLSETGRHQGVIAWTAAYDYSSTIFPRFACSPPIRQVPFVSCKHDSGTLA